jgi:hypothetical protein
MACIVRSKVCLTTGGILHFDGMTSAIWCPDYPSRRLAPRRKTTVESFTMTVRSICSRLANMFGTRDPDHARGEKDSHRVWTPRRACPSCGARLERLQRQAIDRAIVMFVPVHRYRCRACDWRGRLRVRALVQPGPLRRLCAHFRYHFLI